MMLLMKIYQKDKNWIRQYCLFVRFRIRNDLRALRIMMFLRKKLFLSKTSSIHRLNLKFIKNWNVAYPDYVKNGEREWLLKEVNPMFFHVIAIFFVLMVCSTQFILVLSNITLISSSLIFSPNYFDIFFNEFKVIISAFGSSIKNQIFS